MTSGSISQTNMFFAESFQLASIASVRVSCNHAVPLYYLVKRLFICTPWHKATRIWNFFRFVIYSVCLYGCWNL